MLKRDFHKATPIQVKEKPDSTSNKILRKYQPISAAQTFTFDSKEEQENYKTNNDKPTQEDFSLEEIAKPHHRKTKTELLGFASKQHADENFKFVFEIIEIEKELTQAQSEGNIDSKILEKNTIYQTKFKAIYDKYIPDTAPQQINISAPIRESLEEENSRNHLTDPKQKTYFTLANFKIAYEEIKTHTASSILTSFHHSNNSSHQNLHDTTRNNSPDVPRGSRPKLNVNSTPSQKPVLLNTQTFKDSLAKLLLELSSYLISIKKYEVASSACCCFSYCSVDKKQLFINMKTLHTNIQNALIRWNDGLIPTLTQEISTALDTHLKIIDDDEYEMILFDSLKTVLSTFGHVNPSQLRLN